MVSKDPNLKICPREDCEGVIRSIGDNKWFAMFVKVLSVQLASSPPTQANVILMKFNILRITCTIVSAKNASLLLKRIKGAIT